MKYRIGIQNFEQIITERFVYVDIAYSYSDAIFIIKRVRNKNL